MKKHFLIALALLLGAVITKAQDKSPYTFTNVVQQKAGITEDQCATGTCWSFATISFLEAEIIRKGYDAVDLSEMFNVRFTYPRKAESFVRYQGKQQFGPGGLAHDAINIMGQYGLVPEEAYSGLPAGKKEHDHGMLDEQLEVLVKKTVEKEWYKMGNEWSVAVNSLLESHLGKAPESFVYKGKTYTPASFRDELKLNSNDYVSFTSFTHHPFNTTCVLEVPDNWSKGSFYNVTLDDMQHIADNALENGYTIAWDADVSEPGFSFKHGLAILPEKRLERDEMFKSVVTEVKVDQSARQYAFDTQATTDDHLMHITGKAKDQNGKVYYFTKNSWGAQNTFGGYQYVSEAYFRMKTVSFLVHKDAVPADIRKRLGI